MPRTSSRGGWERLQASVMEGLGRSKRLRVQAPVFLSKAVIQLLPLYEAGKYDSQQRLGLEAAIGEPDFDPAEFKMINGQNEEKQYDVIVVGAGSAGSVLAAELFASGAQVLVIESGGRDDAPTIANPSSGSTTSAVRLTTTYRSSRCLR